MLPLVIPGGFGSAELVILLLVLLVLSLPVLVLVLVAIPLIKGWLSDDSEESAELTALRERVAELEEEVERLREASDDR